MAVDQRLPEAVHGGEPLVSRAVDGGQLGAPIVRIAVGVALLLQTGAQMSAQRPSLKDEQVKDAAKSVLHVAVREPLLRRGPFFW